ncbi:putative sam dependent methyltransferase protein [Neofusicoccum parvum UCRNP2]|uniref:Putative sam dependent methyltransferase protein n=1 Tax=Botryosphaeria parva (strain UCR-NP2) TaxID=1287680 RepID=R1G2B6_BOTPV|nr:putative sam dependent methyltransferase protein [Neofusicoccum parvum UCRNP2]
MAEQQPANVINIPVAEDTAGDSSDSAFGDDLSDTTSIASTIWKHRYENGRRYHKGPNDDAQNDQLDIGDFADEFPNCEVIGTDLSPIQPTLCPPNCSFEIDDCTEPWTFPKDSFDMIHIRCLFGSVSDWPALYREVYNHLKPGGWINQMEMGIQFRSDDGTCPPEHTMAEWSKLFLETTDKFGKTMRVVDNMKGWIADAGFEDVTEVKFKLPAGPWSSDPKMKELGKWNLLYCFHGCEGWAMFLLTHVLGWKYEEVMVLVAKFKAALKDKKTHAYYDVSVVYARKPNAPAGT